MKRRTDARREEGRKKERENRGGAEKGNENTGEKRETRRRAEQGDGNRGAKEEKQEKPNGEAKNTENRGAKSPSASSLPKPGNQQRRSASPSTSLSPEPGNQRRRSAPPSASFLQNQKKHKGTKKPKKQKEKTVEQHTGRE